MAKVSLNDVTAGYNLATVYNDNNAALEEAIENTLSRDGTTPNDMQAPLDMGGNRVINLGAPVNDTDAVRVIDIVTGEVTVTPNSDWPDITNVPSNVSDIGDLTDPGSDQLLFWDDSSGNVTWLTVGSGLSITGTSIQASGTASTDWGDIINMPDTISQVADLVDPGLDKILFWDDSAGSLTYLTTGTGLSIAGTTVMFSHLGIQSLADPNADRLMFWDDSGGGVTWLTPGTGLAITGTSIAIDPSGVNVAWSAVTTVPAYLTSLAALTDPGNDRMIFWDDSASNLAHLQTGDNLGITGTTLAFSSSTNSFTGTLTGTTSGSGTVKYSRNGNQVTLEIPTITGTSNSTAHTITGMPTDIRPATAQVVIGITTNNSVDALGLLSIASTGVITLYNVLSATFAGTGTEGVKNCTVSYHLS